MEFTGERVVPDKMAVDILTYTQHLTRYVFALNFCAGKRVLDAACGAGYGLDLISSVASGVVGIDNSKESLEYAAKNYHFYNKYFSFWEADLEHASFEFLKGLLPFEVITSFETIEHLENPDFFLSNVKNALADDGVFVFSIPNTNPSLFHKQIYDIEEAKKLITNHFKKVNWYGQSNIDIGPCAPGITFFIGVARK